MRRRSLAVVPATLALLAITSIAAAGGWASVTATDVPIDPPPGQETTIALEVRQHGQTPVSWPRLNVIATDATSGTVVRAAATPVGPEGSYTTTLVFPTAGEWSLTFDSNDLIMDGKVAVNVAAAAVPPAVTRAQASPALDVLPLAVVVVGPPDIWITGRPHFFWYFARDGSIIEDSRRLVGETLAWERDGVLYRIEGVISRETALEIARSMR